MEKQSILINKITSLSKRRGFIFPGSEIYGGLAGTWDLGPLGFELRKNIISEWQKFFVYSRDDVFLISSSILGNVKIWEASGHTKFFIDPMVDCKSCKMRFKLDEIDSAKVCPECGGGEFTDPRPFNMMFKTFVGPVENDSTKTYLRPETAQGMFINFKNILDSFHLNLPFGIAQAGKAFRNEITPRNFIFRSREFEQMELEWFCQESDWQNWFDYWLKRIKEWLFFIGLSENRIHFKEVDEHERAHYSKRTVDVEYDFPFGCSELYGLAYRTDFDLSSHIKKSGINLPFVPHVIEPTFGVERTILALLCDNYIEDKERTILKFQPKLAPIKAAVFPLLANKPDLINKAKMVYKMLREEIALRHGYMIWWDQRGNIGKRYYSQDEIGTPWCITIDYQTLKDETVTLRDRDTAKQIRVKIGSLVQIINDKLI